MTPESIILIISASAAPLLAMWNTWQGIKIRELELKYENLCNNCIYDFTPKPNYMKETDEVF